MKLKESVRRIWRSVEAFAYALDGDQHSEISMRVERLRRDGQAQRAALVALSEDVRGLSEQVRRLTGARGWGRAWPSRLQSARCPAPEAGIERRQHEQREQRGAEQPADHHCRQRLLHLRPGTVPQRHRHEAEAGDQSRHRHRP